MDVDFYGYEHQPHPTNCPSCPPRRQMAPPRGQLRLRGATADHCWRMMMNEYQKPRHNDIIWDQ